MAHGSTPSRPPSSATDLDVGEVVDTEPSVEAAADLDQAHDEDAGAGIEPPATTVPPRSPAAAIAGSLRAEPTGALLAVAITVWCIVFGRLMWQRHARFGTFDFDLGHHDQAIWLLAHGKGFITVSGMPVFGHHMTLAYFAVVPLYWLGGG